MRRLLVKFVCVFLGLWGHAQDAASFKVVQWTSRGLLVNPKNSSEAFLLPLKGEKEPVPAPAKLSTKSDVLTTAPVPGDVFSFEGKYYCQTFSPEPGHPENTMSELHRMDGKTWTRVGWFSRDRKLGRTLFFPLSNEKFLGMSRKPLVDASGKPLESPFGIFRVHPEKAQFLFETAIEPGLENIFKLDPFQLWSLCQFVFTDDFLTLVVPKSSMYWTFSMESGRLRRHGKFLASVPDELIATPLLPSLLINLQPTPGGKIILVTRPEDMITEMKEGLADVRHIERLIGESKGADLSNALKAWRQRQDELVSRFPFVTWWSYDPSNGNLTRLDPPPTGAKSILGTFADLQAFQWVPTREGGVRFVSGDFHELEPKVPAQAPVKKPTPLKKAG